MKHNVGTADKIIRIILAIVLIALGYLLGGAWMVVGIVIAVILLITVLLGWCGLYVLLGMSTCPTKAGKPSAKK